jgi:YVTN family beta-propeller protein
MRIRIRLILAVAVLALLAFPAAPLAGISEVAAMNISNPVAVAADEARNIVYVSSPATNTISVINGATRQVIATIARPAGGVPVGIAVDTSSSFIYDLDAALSKVVVWKKVGSAYQTIATIAVPPTARGIAADAAFHRVYVVSDPSSGSGIITVISGASASVIGHLLLPGHPTGDMALNATQNVIYTTATGDGTPSEVAAVDVATDQIVSLTTISKNPQGVGVDPAKKLLFVSRRDANDVLALPLDGNGLVTAPTPATPSYAVPVDVAPGPISVDTVTHRVYVSSAGSGPSAVLPASVDGKLTVLEPTPTTYTVVERIGVGRMTQALAADTANSRVFVANAGGPGLGPIAASPGSVSVVSRFEPLAHGFHFANAFSSGGLTATLPIVGKVNFGALSYGLCGGMVFAALDSYEAGGAAPATVNAPGAGTQLRGYLFARLLDTLLPNNAAVLRRFLQWMALPLHDNAVTKGLVSRTNDEFVHKIHPQLAQGQPVPLGLVKTSFNPIKPAFGKVWDNHQVLAIGDSQNASGQWVIELYDPNVPDRTSYLQIDRRVETSDKLGTTVIAQFRGFFAIDYSPKHPYWVP